MHFGMFMQFETRPGGSQASAFAEGFELVDTAEACGLDGAWLAEMHFTPDRSVLSSPITIASSIATRTRRLRIGMAVYVLPLNNPLRIVEEVGTVDQISEGRFGRGSRFRTKASSTRWRTPPVAPLPYQKPHPPFRMAATTSETFPRAGEDGYPIFVGLRGMDIPELRRNLNEYRKAWKAAGHEGNGNVSLRIPVYLGPDEKAAIEEPFESIQNYFGRMGRLYAADSGSAGIQQTELRDQRAERLSALSYDDILETKGGLRDAGGTGRQVHTITRGTGAGRCGS